jgi:sec-independent protein translocase protein TatB|tara:strand:+ start:583 stop:930 length:348 start_codon:yes stop_codon:yes gene_type:complete
MFDLGFPELLLVGIVALLVIGPNELPQAIRTLSLWIGRLRRSFTKIRQEIEKEVGADEIRLQLHNEEIMQELEETQSTFEETKEDINKIIGEGIGESKASLTLDNEENVDRKHSD